jgi:hypothetical protein
MSKKKLDISSITNELRGQSVFFPTDRAQQNDHKQPPPTPPFAEQNKPGAESTDTVIPRHHDTVIDTTIPSNHDTTIPLTEDEMLESIRKSVKKVGRGRQHNG